MRTRSAGIVIKDGRILLIFRKNEGKEYYSFPGGGVEVGETNEEACAREVLEETSIKVKVGRLLYIINWDDDTKSLYYLCEYVSGEPRLAQDAPEIEEMKDGRQYYDPVWIDISALSKTLLYSLEARDFLITDLKSGFKKESIEIFIKIAERKQSI